MGNPAETQPKDPGGETSERRARLGGLFRGRDHLKWLVLGVVVVAAGLAFGIWHYFASRESTDDAQIDGHIIPISARVSGTVLEVNVDDNQSVEAGQVLVKLDPKDFETAVEHARADLAVAEAAAEAARTGVPITSITTGSQLSTSSARLESAHAGVAATQKEVDAAQARRAAAEARLAEAQARSVKASRDLDRMKLLISKEEISQQQYDAAVADADAARATVESAKADSAEAEQNMQVARSRLVQANATLAQARAEVEAAETAPQQVAVTRAHADAADAGVKMARAVLAQAELNLQYTTVQAPASGEISHKTVQVGQIIQAGQPLMALVPLQDIWVTANFKETQLKNMRPGQPAFISVDAFGGRKYEGHVDSIAAATGEKFSLLPPENATGNYVKVVQRVPVKIVFEKGQDPEHLLRPGMSVVPTVITK
jgi:membrane fusion protein (multidrug efflux system)